jgi:hypothetical protein
MIKLYAFAGMTCLALTACQSTVPHGRQSAALEPVADHCLITVDGTVHLDAPCPVDDSDPSTVTLNTGTDTTPEVFVYLNTYEGVTEAFWNGGQGASHAQAPLGEVTRSGRCWTNARIRICRPD